MLASHYGMHQCSQRICSPLLLRPGLATLPGWIRDEIESRRRNGSIRPGLGELDPKTVPSRVDGPHGASLTRTPIQRCSKTARNSSTESKPTGTKLQPSQGTPGGVHTPPQQVQLGRSSVAGAGGSEMGGASQLSPRDTQVPCASQQT